MAWTRPAWKSVEELLPELRSLPCDRSITHLVMHHTAIPTRKQWAGDSSASAILTYWLKEQKARGWKNPLGGQFIVSPTGRIYLPFSLSVAANCNSSLTVNKHGIALEVVGSFDVGGDLFDGVQRHATIGLFAGLCVRFGLTEEAVHLHREYNKSKTCPGSAIDRSHLRRDIVTAIPWARERMG